MTTAASLAGVSEYGLGWRRKITLNVPNDIPGQIEKLETTLEVNKFVDDTVSNIHKTLKKTINGLPPLPADSIRPLEAMLEELEESLLGDPFNTTVNPELVKDAERVENKVEDLMYFLNDLYDWADYYRVLITTPRV